MNKKNTIHHAKVKCLLCGKVGFSSDKKGLARHSRLAHGKNYIDGLFVEVEDDIPVDIIPKDKIAFKKIVNRLKKKNDNAQANANYTRHKQTNPKRKSIYWGAVIKTAFETKR